MHIIKLIICVGRYSNIFSYATMYIQYVRTDITTQHRYHYTSTSCGPRDRHVIIHHLLLGAKMLVVLYCSCNRMIVQVIN